MESTGARMSRLGTSIMNELPILSVDETIERIDAVGIEDVAALAAELFAPSRLSVAGVGPDEEAFRAAIEPLSEAHPPRTQANGRAGPDGSEAEGSATHQVAS
jgi:hypothetical protein